MCSPSTLISHCCRLKPEQEAVHLLLDRLSVALPSARPWRVAPHAPFLSPLFRFSSHNSLTTEHKKKASKFLPHTPAPPAKQALFSYCCTAVVALDTSDAALLPHYPERWGNVRVPALPRVGQGFGSLANFRIFRGSARPRFAGLTGPLFSYRGRTYFTRRMVVSCCTDVFRARAGEGGDERSGALCVR